jgi:hypothetical protein
LLCYSKEIYPVFILPLNLSTGNLTTVFLSISLALFKMYFIISQYIVELNFSIFKFFKNYLELLMEAPSLGCCPEECLKLEI